MTLNELLRNRVRFFWILNVAGWSGYVLTAYLGALAHEKPDAYIAVIVAMAVVGFLLTIPMRLLYRRLWGRSPVTIAIGVIITSYVLAFGWRWFSNTIYYEWVKGGWQPEGLMDYVGGVMGSFYILLCWSGLYYGIKYYQQLQDQTERTLQATAAASSINSKRCGPIPHEGNALLNCGIYLIGGYAKNPKTKIRAEIRQKTQSENQRKVAPYIF